MFDFNKNSKTFLIFRKVPNSEKLKIFLETLPGTTNNLIGIASESTSVSKLYIYPLEGGKER